MSYLIRTTAKTLKILLDHRALSVNVLSCLSKVMEHYIKTSTVFECQNAVTLIPVFLLKIAYNVMKKNKHSLLL